MNKGDEEVSLALKSGRRHWLSNHYKSSFVILSLYLLFYIYYAHCACCLISLILLEHIKVIV